MRLIVAEGLEEKLEAMDTWWRINRPARPHLFTEELRARPRGSLGHLTPIEYERKPQAVTSQIGTVLALPVGVVGNLTEPQIAVQTMSPTRLSVVMTV